MYFLSVCDINFALLILERFLELHKPILKYHCKSCHNIRNYIQIVKEMLYAVRCLKSNEDMILALAGQFKQLSHEPEKFR